MKGILARHRIEAFLAHEDIDVSVEWRTKILEEIGKADIFICLLSASYLQSPWCVQEAGIAAFRGSMAFVPLSLDGTIPTGFASAFQAVRVHPASITMADMLPAFLKYDFAHGIQLAIDLIGQSRSFRGAEENFKMILPYVSRMSNTQVRDLLQRAADNDQVHCASLCITEYIPPLLRSHGRFLSPKTRALLKRVVALYARD